MNEAIVTIERYDDLVDWKFLGREHTGAYFVFERMGIVLKSGETKRYRIVEVK